MECHEEHGFGDAWMLIKDFFLETISWPFQDQGLSHGCTPLVDNESQVQARRILLILIESALPFDFDHRYEACRFTKLSLLSDEFCISIESAMAWRLEHVVEIEWVRLCAFHLHHHSAFFSCLDVITHEEHLLMLSKSILPHGCWSDGYGKQLVVTRTEPVEPLPRRTPLMLIKRFFPMDVDLLDMVVIYWSKYSWSWSRVLFPLILIMGMRLVGSSSFHF